MSEKDENIVNNEELTEETHENDGHKSSSDKKNQIQGFLPDDAGDIAHL